MEATTYNNSHVVYYLSNGLCTQEYPHTDVFFVQESIYSDEHHQYAFAGDEIIYDICDELCIELYKLFQNKIISNMTKLDLRFLPTYIAEAGINAESSLSQQEFERLVDGTVLYNSLRNYTSKTNDGDNQLFDRIKRLKNPFLYLYDCQHLVSTLQDLLIHSENDFVLFYKYLSKIQPLSLEDMNGFMSGPDVSLAIDLAQSVFVKIASALDIISKIAYELSHIRDTTNTYPKMASSKILYKTSLDIDKVEKNGTIFDVNNKAIRYLLAIRNEVIHNGSWDEPLKVYLFVKDHKVCERCIYLPDETAEGSLATYKNRKHFFSKGNKLNERLPELYTSWLKTIHRTLQNILKYHTCGFPDN